MPSLVEKLFLRYSSNLALLRRVPGLSGLIHSLSTSVLPPDRPVWIKVRSGLGEGLWLKLTASNGRRLL